MVEAEFVDNIIPILTNPRKIRLSMKGGLFIILAVFLLIVYTLDATAQEPITIVQPADQTEAVATTPSNKRILSYLYEGASITIGIGTRETSLTVTRKSDHANGKIAQQNEGAYFVSYSTRPSFIRSTRFGYTFMFNYSTFTMDKQEVSKNAFEDIGTSVRGSFAYFVPTLFYQWGEGGPKGKSVRAGIGLGLGAAKFSGNIKLTSVSPAETINTSNGSYDIKFAVSAFLEGRYRPWVMKISIAGPSYEDDTYKYSVADFTVSVGYSFFF